MPQCPSENEFSEFTLPPAERHRQNALAGCFATVSRGELGQSFWWPAFVSQTAMHDHEKDQLLYGPYKMPSCKLGKELYCEIRGWVPVKRISDGRISWPQTLVGRNRAFILCGDLVRAVKTESDSAIQFWWRVGPNAVWTWRKALDVPRYTEGTTRLHSTAYAEFYTEENREKAIAAMNTPEANAKKAAAKLGKPRPKHVIEALREANLDRSLGEEQRQKMSEAHKRRGTRPPKAGRAWAAEEDALLGTATDREVGQRISRTAQACATRRGILGISSFSGKGPKKQAGKEEAEISMPKGT